LGPVSGSTHVQAPIKTGVKAMQLEIEQGMSREITGAITGKKHRGKAFETLSLCKIGAALAIT
jgi:hypothetical protein